MATDGRMFRAIDRERTMDIDAIVAETDEVGRGAVRGGGAARSVSESAAHALKVSEVPWRQMNERAARMETASMSREEALSAVRNRWRVAITGVAFCAWRGAYRVWRRASAFAFASIAAAISTSGWPDVDAACS